MTDVKMKFEDLRFDLAFTQGAVETEIGLENAVMISLFTDARVLEDELPKGETFRGGWFGDLISEYPDDQIGSKLWLLNRAGNKQETRNKAEQYAREALQWLVADGVAESINVRAYLVNKERIDLDIEIFKPDERAKFFWRYQLLWEGQMMKARKVI